MADKTVTITFLSDTSGFQRGANQAATAADKLAKSTGDVSKGAEQAGQSLTAKLSGGLNLSTGQLIRGAAAAAGFYVGILGVAQVVGRGLHDALAGGIADAKAYNEIQAQTANVLKSTNEAAGLTQQQIVDIGNAFEQTTKFGNDQVQSMENVLLTFTSINKDVFPQTTGLILDISQALGQDLQQSAIQVGKALNDPAIGMANLQRIGVSFTKEQIDQAKAMEAAGNIAGAQAIILGELNREFGGSAAAAEKAAGGVDVAKNRLTDARRELAEQMIPALQDAEVHILNFATDALTAAQNSATLVQGMHNIGTAATAAANDIAQVIGTLNTLNNIGGNKSGGGFLGFLLGAVTLSKPRRLISDTYNAITGDLNQQQANALDAATGGLYSMIGPKPSSQQRISTFLNPNAPDIVSEQGDPVVNMEKQFKAALHGIGDSGISDFNKVKAAAASLGITVGDLTDQQVATAIDAMKKQADATSDATAGVDAFIKALDGGGSGGRTGGGGGSVVSAADAAKAALQAQVDAATQANRSLFTVVDRIQNQRMHDEIAAYLKGGDAAVAAVKKSQAEQEKAINDTAAGIQKALGVDMPTALNAAFESVTKKADELLAKARELDQTRLTSANLLSGAVGQGGTFNINPQQIADMVAAGTLKPDQVALLNAVKGKALTQTEYQQVLHALPGFGGGGTVPGPIGSPRIILAHGGEEVIPVGGGGLGGAQLHVIRVQVGDREAANIYVRGKIIATEQGRG